MKKNEGYLNDYAALCKEADRLEPEMFDRYEVQRGLRDKNGNGVVTGLTNISRIDSFQVVDGKKTPCEGKLWYRGYDCIELVKGFRGKHTGFEEVAYLLLFGELPTQQQLKEFREILSTNRTLPTNFTRDVIMKASSSDIMNSLTRSVLTLASYDKNCSDTGIENVLRQCIGLISVFPMPNLFKYLYMSGESGFQAGGFDVLVNADENAIIAGQIAGYLKISKEDASHFLQNIMIYTHGLASFIASGIITSSKEEVKTMVKQTANAFLSQANVKMTKGEIYANKSN